MSQYKELADRLEAGTLFPAQWNKLVAILRSLDAKPAGRVLIDDGGVHINPYIRDADAAGLTHGQEVYAAPVAAQPQQAKPEPLSDADYYEIGQRYSIPTVKIQAIHRELEAKRGIKEQG